MIIYNVTVSIDENVEQEWLEWMRSIHIPEVMETGHFRDSKICRVHGEEEGGKTYAITYTSHSKENLEKYMEEDAPKLQADHNKKFHGKCASFRTTMDLIEEFQK